MIVAFLVWVFTIFAAGATDRSYFRSSIPYEGQVWFFRAFALLVPILAYFVTKRVCEKLRAGDTRPLRGWNVTIVRRNETMGFEELHGRRRE